MTWLLAGIIPPILWALVNHTDKYLLSKAHHQSSVNVLMVYSTGFSFIALPFLFYFSRHELFVDSTQVIIQVIGGILLTLGVYFYLVALNKDETSVVIPFAMLIPVFGYLFSVVLLHEILSVKQIIACVLIIVGALILTVEFNEERKIRIRHGVLIFMVLSTFFQAAQGILFKFVTIENSYAASVFWQYIGVALCGIALVVFKKGLFGQFLYSVKQNGKLIFGANVLSEGINGAAYMIRDYALLLAPATIILTLNGYQPVFVFVLGILLTLWFPKFASEKIKPVHLLHKGLAIAVILVGTLIINQTLN